MHRGSSSSCRPTLTPRRFARTRTRPLRAAAVRSGEISGYFLVPADYLRSGSAVLVTPELSLMTADQRSGQLDYVLRYNLAGDANLASLLRDPTPAVVATSLAPAPSTAETTTARARRLFPADRRDVHPFLCHHDERQLHAAKRGQGEGEPHR